VADSLQAASAVSRFTASYRSCKQIHSKLPLLVAKSEQAAALVCASVTKKTLK